MGRRDRNQRQSRQGDVGRDDQGTPGQEYYANDGYIPTGEQGQGYYDAEYDGLTSGLERVQMRDPMVNPEYYGPTDDYSVLDPQGYPAESQMSHSTYTQPDGQPLYPEYPSVEHKRKQPAGASGVYDPSDYPDYPDGTTAAYGHGDQVTGDALNDDYVEAMRQSRQTAILGTYSQPSQAGPSAYGPPEEEPEPMISSSLNPDTTESSSFVITQDNDFVFDSRYKKEHSKKYQPGAVFKTLWAEPHGQAPPTDDPLTEYPGSIQGNLKNFYVGIRRFIVVATDHGHSSCVPILTYEHRGCKKSGIRPLQHGIIYARGSQPYQLRNEPDMGFNPVALDMTVREKLDKESRVNYSKIVDVEHNTKVYFIGRIKKDDFIIVQDAVNYCWYNKIHGPSN